MAAHSELPMERPAEADEKQQLVNLDKLGRQRPEIFSSTAKEVAFVISMLGALTMADFVIGGFQVVLPFLVGPLEISPETQTWPVSVLTLVAGATLFPLGRVTDMYGGYLVFHGGLLWFTLWTVLGGFSQNFTMLVISRAMEGLGAAAFLPAGISLLGRIYRPGPRKNLVFSLYGAIAPLGFWVGLIFGGMAEDLLEWRWFFWLGGVMSGLFCVGSLLTSPKDYIETRQMGVKMDWWGTCTMVPGLLLFVYAITGSSEAANGWATPQIIVTLSLGLIFLAAAVYVEGWVAEAPLIPADIFRVKYMKRMLVCLFISWGVFSIYLYYSNFYITKILHKSALTTAFWFAPWAAGGLVLATMSGFILHILPGRILLIMTATCKILAVLFFALMPENPTYWAWVFPAMLAEAACTDVLWTVSNVFLTTSLPAHRQGLAGALISVSLFLGGAFFLAIADVAKSAFASAGMDLKTQYKNLFWLGVGFAAVAFVVCFFIKIGKADCSSPEDRVDNVEVKEPDSDSDAASKLSNSPSGLSVTDSEGEASSIMQVENGVIGLGITNPRAK